MLALNPRAIADARALDAERAAGRVRGPFHGIPVAFKDNIDVLGLPTTGGSRALVDHRPRLDSRVAAGMRRAGAVVLGKANLDEFPFGDFGISTRRRHDRQRVRSVAQHVRIERRQRDRRGDELRDARRSAPTRATRCRTRQSFASLATIRTTRGLTSRAGVMPLNTFNDAVGPMAKSVRELALVLDQVTGRDAEDEATADAGRAHRAARSRRRWMRQRSRARASACCDSSSSASPASARPRRMMDARGRRSCARPARPSSTSRFPISTREYRAGARQRARIAEGRLDGVSDARRRRPATRC